MQSSPLLSLIRPSHWIKNLIILGPLLLSFGFLEKEKVLISLIAVISWSFLASAGYIFNDLRDIEHDRAHPLKRNRPLASGAVPKQQAIWLMLALLILGLALAFTLKPIGFKVALVYVGLNLLYSLWLKRIRWLDIIVLSSFYLLRIFLGGYIIETPLTHWFVATCLFAFLALSANKRMLSCKVTEESPIPSSPYHPSERPFLHLLSIVFAVTTIIFLNLHLIQLLGTENRPVDLVFVNLVSILLLLFYFDDKKTKHDDPVKKILSHIPSMVLLLLLLLFYLYLLPQS